MSILLSGCIRKYGGASERNPRKLADLLDLDALQLQAFESVEDDDLLHVLALLGDGQRQQHDLLQNDLLPLSIPKRIP